MTTEEEKLVIVHEEHSYIYCLSKGIVLGFKNLGALLRYTWPSLVLAIVLPIPFVFFFYGQMNTYLRHWASSNELPNASWKTFKSEYLHNSLRNALSFAILLLVAIVVAGISLAPHFIGFNKWYCMATFLVLLFVVLPFDVVSMCLNYSNDSLDKCLVEGTKTGYGNYGTLFAYALLRGFAFFWTTLLGSLPLIVVMITGLQAYEGYVNGDAIDLPTLFPLLGVVAFFISMFVSLSCSIVLSFCNCLMWGSLVKEVPTQSEVDI